MSPDQMTISARCIRKACKIGGITIAMLDSRSRRDSIVLVRHMIAAYLTEAGVHANDIAVLLNRCRTDVLAACKSFQSRIDTDKHARACYQKLKEAL